jgi:hypothetical protein
MMIETDRQFFRSSRKGNVADVFGNLKEPIAILKAVTERSDGYAE